MNKVLSSPPADAHIAPCGLFCTNCKKFKRGKCQGCQVQAGFAQCPVRNCCEEKGIATCASCGDFAAPHGYRECKKVFNPIARVISFFTGSDRPAALAMLRDSGVDGYLAAKRSTGKM